MFSSIISSSFLSSASWSICSTGSSKSPCLHRIFHTEFYHGIQINSLSWNHFKVINNQIIISILVWCFIFVRVLFIGQLHLRTKVASQCLHVLFFFTCFLRSTIFGHLFMCRTILNRFFEVTSQSREMHLKTLSSSSKLGTIVATLLFVGRWFALKQKINVLPEKCKQNEPDC